MKEEKEIPTPEQVKEHFKDAVKVRCLSNDNEYLMKDISFSVDSYFSGLDKLISCAMIWHPIDGYAQITEYKKPISEFEKAIQESIEPIDQEKANGLEVVYSKSIFELEHERMEWSKKMFPQATAYSSIEKLIGEAREIQCDIVNGKQEPEEYADCLMCLFDSAGRQDKPISVQEIFEAFAKKLEINKNRVWRKNADDTYSHVKPLLTTLNNK